MAKETVPLCSQSSDSVAPLNQAAGPPENLHSFDGEILYNVHMGRLGADSTACLIEHTAAHRSAPLTAYIEVRRNVPCDASI
jgi:hypothetical protein